MRGRLRFFAARLLALAAAGAVAAASAPATARASDVGPIVKVRLEPADPDEFAGREVVRDRLAEPTVLELSVVGFPEFSVARVRQCELGTRQVCAAGLPVHFGEQGTARFQFLVAPPRAGACRAETLACLVRVDAPDVAASFRIVFHDAVPPAGSVAVTPVRNLHAGDEVRVDATGFPAGAEVAPLLCAVPHRSGREGCSAPGTTVVVGADGRATTSFRLPARLGTVIRSCGRTTRCGISMVGASVDPGAAVVPVSFASPPGADYDARRLVGGLGIAFGFALVAVWLVRRTDWSPVGEIAAPEIDDAEYADLDALVAAQEAAEAAAEEAGLIEPHRRVSPAPGS